MDIHNVLVTAAEEVLHAVDQAKKELAGKATVDYPTKIDIEFGITASYEVANYDDVRIATVRVSVPLFKGSAAAESTPPEKPVKTEHENGDKKGDKKHGKGKEEKK